MEATLYQILTEEERSAPIFPVVNPGDVALKHLSAKQISDLFLVIKGRYISSDGKVMAGNIVCMVWEELTERAIMKRLSIF